jgi:transcriptional regulator with XRE-family HTH domain
MTDSGLGPRLRELRTQKGLGLREVATRAEVNHGYLSQLERGEVAQPAPAILQKLSRGYGEPFILLMRWAGYIEDGELSANQARALSYMGDDLSDQELTAVKAVLDAIRTKSAQFSSLHSLDANLDAEDVAQIRGQVLALVRKADVAGQIPTPIDQVMDVARLVSAGEVTLDPEERRKLRRVFGDLVDVVLSRLQGVIHFPSGEVWVNPEMYPLRQRFVKSHEIGHHVLPWHRDLFAYLDDATRLRPDVHHRYEREANQAAIELLAQGDQLRREADDSELDMQLVDRLASRYSISLQAAARRIVEESRQECALAIAFRGSVTGMLMPHHLYCSAAFEERFRWRATNGAATLIEQSLGAAQRGDAFAPVLIADVHGRGATLQLDAANTPRAMFVLFRALPSKLVRFRRAMPFAEQQVELAQGPSIVE